jgi:hypothetical protein
MGRNSSMTLYLTMLRSFKPESEVILRPTVSRPVSLQFKSHLGLKTRFLLLSATYGFVYVGRPLWREDESVVCNYCWSSPAQSFSGPSPTGLMTIFYCLRFETHGSRDSVVGIATGYWSSSPGGVKNFLFSTSSRPALGPTQPLIQWITGSLSPEAKLPGCEVDHSLPTSAEVQKMWIYTSTPPDAFMA